MTKAVLLFHFLLICVCGKAQMINGLTPESVFTSRSRFVRSFSPADECAVNRTDEKLWLDKTEVRPFITDDARVVGKRLAQLESWFRKDKEAAQQWVMAAYGPTDKLEVSIGGVFGMEKDAEHNRSFSYGLPLIQAKYLFKPYAPGKGPGFGMVAGSFLPAGKGSFKPAGYGSFSFATISQCFGKREDLLLHLNTGFNYLHIDGTNDVLATWGFGTQVRTIDGFHMVGEIFSGDPYMPGAGMSYQAGFRHFFSDLLQIDMTVGKGIAGDNPLPFWYSTGIRMVFTRFAKKQHERLKHLPRKDH